MAIKIPLGYLEGNTTKYVARWRKKHGIEDLKKAMHYLDKLIETVRFDMVWRMCPEIETEVRWFAQANELTELEHDYMLMLCTYTSMRDLGKAKFILQQLIEQSLHRPGTPDDGGQHGDIRNGGQ